MPSSPPTRRDLLVWPGVLLALAGAVSYFAYFVRFPALRDRPWLNLGAVSLGAGLAVWGALGAFRGRVGLMRGLVAMTGLVLTLLVGAGFFGYVFVLTDQLPAPSERTLALETAPDFTLTNQHGRPVRLSNLRGRRVLLVFYRGHW